MIKVKICGITNLEDAVLASGAGADAVGFIFSKKSPRYISEQKAAGIIRQLDPFLIKAGVFLDEEKQKVLDIASSLNLDVLQFHGRESPSYCRFFRPKFRIVKVFFPEDSPYGEKLLRYEVDAFMFDIKYEEKARGRKALMPKEIKEIAALIKEGKRIIISGGLNVENISKISKLKPYAVDVSSGLEKMAGKKDSRLIKAFVDRVKL